MMDIDDHEGDDMDGVSDIIGDGPTTSLLYGTRRLLKGAMGERGGFGGEGSGSERYSDGSAELWSRSTRRQNEKH